MDETPFSKPGFSLYRESLCLNFMAIGHLERMLFHHCVYRWKITVTTDTYPNTVTQKTCGLKNLQTTGSVEPVSLTWSWNSWTWDIQYVFFHWILCKLWTHVPWTLGPLLIQFWILIIYQCSTPNIIALSSLVLKNIFKYLIDFYPLGPFVAPPLGGWSSTK